MFMLFDDIIQSTPRKFIFNDKNILQTIECTDDQIKIGNSLNPLIDPSAKS